MTSIEQQIYDVSMSPENNATITITLTSIGCQRGGQNVSDLNLSRLKTRDS